MDLAYYPRQRRRIERYILLTRSRARRIAPVMSRNSESPQNGRHVTSPYGSYAVPHTSSPQANSRQNPMAITGILNPPAEDRAYGVPAQPRPSLASGNTYYASTNPYPVPMTSGGQVSTAPRPTTTASATASSRDRNRPFRPPYTDEEVHFVYYHRCDLSMDWPEIIRAFNLQFPHRPRDIQGVQCRYYRFREDRHLPMVRDAAGRSSTYENRNYGLRRVLGQQNLWYSWMR